VLLYSVVCSFITNKQQNKQPTLFLKMLNGFLKKYVKKKYPSCVLCLLFRDFLGSTNNENACCFPETNQTKMPKSIDLTEGTKWQWFISFGVGFGFWKSLEIMEANECRTGDYGNLSNLSCIRRVLESANVVLC